MNLTFFEKRIMWPLTCICTCISNLIKKLWMWRAFQWSRSSKVECLKNVNFYLLHTSCTYRYFVLTFISCLSQQIFLHVVNTVVQISGKNTYLRLPMDFSIGKLWTKLLVVRKRASLIKDGCCTWKKAYYRGIMGKLIITLPFIVWIYPLVAICNQKLLWVKHSNLYVHLNLG